MAIIKITFIGVCSVIYTLVIGSLILFSGLRI